MTDKKGSPYIGYEYKEVTVPSNLAPMYMDCYECFGWKIEENKVSVSGHSYIFSDRSCTVQRRSFTTIHMKRNRKIINKMELTRLQQYFEACANEIEALEKAKTSAALIWSLVIGIIGTVFLAGSTFAAVHEPPVIWLCILLMIPGITGMILPFSVYRRVIREKTRRIQPIIEAKQEEIYKICEKGHSLL